MFSKFKNPFSSAIKKFITEEIENQLYEKASSDIELGYINKGIWAKAFAKSDGDELKQKAVYLELLVNYYKKEIEAGEELENILASEEQREKKEEQKRSRREREAQKTKEQEEIREDLRKKGYRLVVKGNKYFIYEPYGGKHIIHSLEELKKYLDKRKDYQEKKPYPQI